MEASSSSDYKIEAVEVLMDGGARKPLKLFKTNSDDNPQQQQQLSSSSSPSSASSTLGVRILKGKSLVTVSNLWSQDEIDYMVKESLLASENRKKKKQPIGSEGRVCVRMPTVAAANRNDSLPGPDTHNLDDPLSLELSEYLQNTILERVMKYVDEELDPSIKTTLFGDIIRNSDGTDSEMSILKLYQNNYLEYSTREPAINVYYPPDGHFNIHKDNKALTILLPLSSPTDDFTGGGTAFWMETNPVDGVHSPSLVMKPKAGTALLFGGCVSHKGLTVHSGIRVVFVASFSKLSKKKKTYRVVVAR